MSVIMAAVMKSDQNGARCFHPPMLIPRLVVPQTDGIWSAPNGAPEGKKGAAPIPLSVPSLDGRDFLMGSYKGALANGFMKSLDDTGNEADKPMPMGADMRDDEDGWVLFPLTSKSYQEHDCGGDHSSDEMCLHVSLHRCQRRWGFLEHHPSGDGAGLVTSSPSSLPNGLDDNVELATRHHPLATKIERFFSI